ncbi:MAG TPA: hypothetical protein VHC22_27970 [Pirellulales bacterium]|nr:hypothetical protein [Pirellulales bacterium]
MNRWSWLLALPVMAGCINGVPLPPTPASSRAVPQVQIDGELQETACIQIAQTYIRSLGKDPTQATYVVDRDPQLKEEPGSDESTMVAVITARFLDGTVWRMALKSDGDLSLLAD